MIHHLNWKMGDAIVLDDWKEMSFPNLNTSYFARKVLLVNSSEGAWVETVKVRNPILNGTKWVFETRRFEKGNWNPYYGTCDDPESAKQAAILSLGSA